MDTVRLAEILAYRLRERLGAQVDYRATLLPNELAIGVEMISPEYLRGYSFTFREHEPLPTPILMGQARWENTPMAAITVPLTLNNPIGWENATFQPLPGGPEQPVTFVAGTTIRAGIGGTVPTATTATNVRMRTQIEQIRFNDLDRRARTEIFTPAISEEYNRLYAMAPYTPLVRTVEQEARLEELEHLYNTIALTQEQITERIQLRAMSPAPIPPPPRVRVRVHRHNGGQWDISVKVGVDERTLPAVAVIKVLLNPGDKHFLPSRQSRYASTIRILRNSLEAGLPAQSLHDALRAWVMASENAITSVETSTPSRGVDEDTARLLRAQPATLEVGGLVYKLVPCHATDVRPLIARVRARAIASAQAETVALRDRAQTDARLVISEAERSASRTRAQAEDAARRAGAVMPAWARDNARAAYFRSGHWNVMFYSDCKVRDIRLYVRSWNRVLHWNPIPLPLYNKMPLWVRLGEGGRITIDSVFMRDYITTHIGESSGCMTLQNMPTTIDSNDAILRLEAAISSGMQVINLNSPLRLRVRDYWPQFRDQLPAPVIKWFNDVDAGHRFLSEETNIPMTEFSTSYPQYRWDRTETLADEQDGTFSVDRPPTPISIPIIPPEQVQEVQELIQRAQEATGGYVAVTANPRRRNA